MSTFVVAVGQVASEVKVNEVGDEKKPVANFRIDAAPGFYNVAAWRDLAAKVPMQGSQIIVTGKLTTRSYENNQGVKVWQTEIIAGTIEVLELAHTPMTTTPQPTAAELDADLFAD